MDISHSFKDFADRLRQLPEEYLNALARKANAFYKKPQWCQYPPFGMYVIGVMRHACSSENLTGFYEQLCSFGNELTAKLGFEKMPAYSTLAHFFNTRTAAKAAEWLEEGRKLLVTACRKAGRTLGRLRSTDGKVLSSTHREAVFNPHYGKTMFKGVIDWDLELFTPLACHAASGVADERPYAKRTHDLLKDLKTELDVLDGGYYAFELYCWNAHTPTLIYFPEGTVGSSDPTADLQSAYRACWKDFGYEPDAPVHRQLKFLLEKQAFDVVGRYYRDLQILEAIRNPAEYACKKHVRNWVETGNSRLDSRGLSNRVKHASAKQAERDLFWTCHALQVEALVGLTVA